MTVSDALRTGRKIHRLSDPDTWFRIDGSKVCCFRNGALFVDKYSFNAEELMAADWEPEPVELILKAADLLEAAKAITNTNPQINNRRLSLMESAKLIAEQLGLTG